jgi:hypothetical protein
MRKHLILTAAASVFLFTTSAFAVNLDADTIKDIHSKVKTSLQTKCKNEMDGATDTICACLADKADTSLDDAALALCENSEKGTACVVEAVKTATQKALTPENINACKAAEPAAVTHTTTTTTKEVTQTTPAPAAASTDAAVTKDAAKPDAATDE